MIEKITSGWGITIFSNNLCHNFYSPAPILPSDPGPGNSTAEHWRNPNQYTVTVALTPEVIEILNWAQAKMSEELQLQQLAEQYPVLEDALRDLEVIKALVKGQKSQ